MGISQSIFNLDAPPHDYNRTDKEILKSLTMHHIESCSFYQNVNQCFLLFKVKNSEIFIIWKVVENKEIIKIFYDLESALAAESSSSVTVVENKVTGNKILLEKNIKVEDVFSLLEINDSQEIVAENFQKIKNRYI